jgi:myo-inositol-1(or 4)-monophosphatase
MTTKNSFSKIRDLIVHSTKLAGAKIENNFRVGVKTTHKENRKDLLTEVDLKCQEIIYQTLLSGMENMGYDKDEIGFIGEEDNLQKESKYTFIIDPLDGTKNFVYGIPSVGISIALLVDNELEIGVVYNPIEKLVYHCIRGQGVFSTDSEEREALLKPSTREKEDWLVGVAGLFECGEDQMESLFLANITPDVMSFRRLGATALDLAYLAQGVTDVVVTGRAYIWDIAAMKLMLSELGLGFFDWQGSELVFDNYKDRDRKYRFVAGKKDVVKEVLTYMHV